MSKGRSCPADYRLPAETFSRGRRARVPLSDNTLSTLILVFAPPRPRLYRYYAIRT